jgi:hypothetical protein
MRHAANGKDPQMTTTTFDTLKLATKLEQAGFSSDQAKGAAAALAEAFTDDLVTKTFLDAKLEATKTEILKWMFGQTLVIIGAVLALSRFGH